MSDLVRDFFDAPHGHPRFGTFPEDKFMVGMEFEVGGAYENWGWSMYEKTHEDGKNTYRTFCSARTLDALIEKAEELLKKRKEASK